LWRNDVWNKKFQDRRPFVWNKKNLKTKTVSLSYKSHRSKTANIKFLSANSKHRSLLLHLWQACDWHKCDRWAVAFTTKSNWFQFCFIIFAVLLGKIKSKGRWRSVKLAVFRFFVRMATATIVVIYKFQNFDGQHGQDDNMHHLTKFGSDRWNHFWNMAILWFFKMDFQIL